jgi:hypothetical protein
MDNLNSVPDSSVSSPPVLSPSLQSLYNGLSVENKSIFIKVFRFIWGAVLPYRRLAGPLGCVPGFWAVDLFRLRSGLPSSWFTVLTYIYFFSDQGKNYIRSSIIYEGVILEGITHVSRMTIINGLKRRGYLTRSTSDAGAPYLSRSYSRQTIFIKLTNKGVNLIEGIEKDLYKLYAGVSLDDLTGANKKPG